MSKSNAVEQIDAMLALCARATLEWRTLRALKVACEELQEVASGYGTKREAQKALAQVAEELENMG